MLRLPKVKSPKLKLTIEKQIEGLKVKIQKRLDMYDLWIKNNV